MANDERSSGSERAPSKAEVIRRAVRAGMASLRVMLPCVVTKWDASIQRADVKILIKQAYLDEEDNRKVEPWPVVSGVPVRFPGGGDVRITFPISDGNLTDDDGNRQPATTGYLIFADISLDKWLTGKGGEVDPEIDHQHALADGVFEPGLRSFGSPWSSVPTGHGTIGYDSGVQVHFHKDKAVVASNEAAAQFVALANKVLDELNKIKTAHNTHVHILTLSSGTGTAASPAIQYTPAAVAAEELKAK